MHFDLFIENCNSRYIYIWVLPNRYTTGYVSILCFILFLRCLVCWLIPPTNSLFKLKWFKRSKILSNPSLELLARKSLRTWISHSFSAFYAFRNQRTMNLFVPVEVIFQTNLIIIINIFSILFLTTCLGWEWLSNK